MNNIKLPVLCCPFPSAINPHCEAAYQHTLEWVSSFNLLEELACQSLFSANFYGLIARVYPHTSLKALEISTDFMYLESLTKKQYKMLLVVSEVYRPQLELFKKNKQSIENRIVTLSQPQTRPILRKKAGLRRSCHPARTGYYHLIRQLYGLKYDGTNSFSNWFSTHLYAVVK